MAKRTKPALRSKTTKKTALDTPASLLAYLGRTHDFGPALNERIKAALEPPNPLLNPPDLLVEQGRRPFVERGADGAAFIRIGPVHSFTAAVYVAVGSRHARFTWGCRNVSSEAAARAHWYGNRSHISGEPRPRATVLIDYVAAICKYQGWTW